MRKIRPTPSHKLEISDTRDRKNWQWGCHNRSQTTKSWIFERKWFPIYLIYPSNVKMENWHFIHTGSEKNPPQQKEPPGTRKDPGKEALVPWRAAPGPQQCSQSRKQTRKASILVCWFQLARKIVMLLILEQLQGGKLTQNLIISKYVRCIRKLLKAIFCVR